MDIQHAVSPGDLGILALGLVLAGAVGGLIAGVLEIGGGIVVVPVLYHVLATLGLDEGVRAHVAVGTALAASVPAALARAHNAMRSADSEMLRRWAAPVLVGVLIGSGLTAVANGHALEFVFAFLAVPVVLHLAFGGGGNPPGLRVPQVVCRLVLPSVLGAASAMTGMGGSTLAAPALAWCGTPQPQRSGSAAVLGAIVCIPAALGAIVAGWLAQPLPPDSLGYVNLLGFALIAPVLLLTEPAGTALAYLIDLKRLRTAFAALITILTARMLWDAFG